MPLTAAMAPSNTVTKLGRRDGEWWTGPLREEEDTSWLVFSMVFWADMDVALMAV